MSPHAAHASIQPGDVVFIAIMNPLYRRVAQTTGSPTSHVGIVFDDGRGGWTVAESTFPVAKYTPLDRFIARSADGWFCVRRFRGGLTDRQVATLRGACDAQMGRLYHLGFRYTSSRQFCSKLVYDAYRAATGVEIGRLETFADLLRRRPGTPMLFWRLWFFGAIPWSRLTVTPASQLESHLMETVCASDGVAI